MAGGGTTKAEIKSKIKDSIDKNPGFKKFLHDEKIYGKFVKNTTERILTKHHLGKCDCNFCTEQRKRQEEYILDRIQRNSSPIDAGFDWSNSKEGHYYWSRKHSKYLNASPRKY